MNDRKVLPGGDSRAMAKRVTKMPDGRYLIYYSDEVNPAQPLAKEPEKEGSRKSEETRDHV